jgi:putative hemolysin
VIEHLLAQEGVAIKIDAPWAIYMWYGIAVVSLIASGIFAGNEIGIFSLSKVRLRLRIAKNEKNAIILNEWLQHPTYALEGLLVLQNIMGFAFSAAVTGILSIYHYSEIQQAIISIAVTTPILLIFADIMPKDLFHSYADRWTYKLVPAMKWLFRLITVIPILPLMNALSYVSTRLVNRGAKQEKEPTGPRTEIMALFQESAATGLLTGTQQDLVQRALRLARINIGEIMIPWNRVVGVPSSISTEGFRALVRRYNVSRMPVLGRSMNEVLGIIDVLDVLTAQAAGGMASTSGFKLTDHLHPAMTLIGEQSVRSAITLMQRARQTVAVVVDRQGRAIGLVTMKDLIEELVGDLENW